MGGVFVFQKNKNKKKGKDEKCGSEVTTPENSSSPGMMDMHGEWDVTSPSYFMHCYKGSNQWTRFLLESTGVADAYMRAELAK